MNGFRYPPKVTFYEAACTHIDHEAKVIHCEDISEIKSSAPEFSVSYDYLVVATGAINNTFGTPGVHENAHFLKSIEDANAIRKAIVDSFETANYPSCPPDERRKLLSFVIVGGGPTGVEFAGELHGFDFLMNL